MAVILNPQARFPQVLMPGQGRDALVVKCRRDEFDPIERVLLDSKIAFVTRTWVELPEEVFIGIDPDDAPRAYPLLRPLTSDKD